MLIEPFDTWPGMESAMYERYWDALELAIAPDQRATGAVYLCGYCVEMLLKISYFQYTNLSSNLDLMNGPIQTAMQSPYWNGRRSGHNLYGWAVLLIDTRAQQGRGFTPSFSAQLVRYTLIIESFWRETLRYRYSKASNHEVQEVFQAADWLLSVYQSFWK